MSKRFIRMTLLAAAATVALVTTLEAPSAFACALQIAPAASSAPAAGLPAGHLLDEVPPLALEGLFDPLVAAGGSSCCDPAKEPGTGGNPFCFEGHSCCANGQWACNNHDATPSCTVCGGSCSPAGATCASNASCCSGACKKGRCR